MTIPPFPSQDLAKLVLGYLAEEQLMTAYDEFLQASPYLDVLKNEYDRIFMTSLKNILAEYRAVKIYVETCKPFVLRRRLVQCTNLIDVVKLLVTYADVNKLQLQDTCTDKISLLKKSTSTQSKHNVSEEGKCSVQTSHVETSSFENSVETTALEDLPGSHSSRKKYGRDSTSESNLNSSENNRHSAAALSTSDTGQNCYSHIYHSRTNENSLNAINNAVKAADNPECREKIEEFNNILHKVCNKSHSDSRLFTIPQSETSNGTNLNSGSEVSGGQEIRNAPVPDSSTSENSIAPTFVRDDKNTTNEASKISNEHSGIQPSTLYPYPKIKSKEKIKIISDIKVDSPFANMSTATSTPLMQTIVINGTPAYKPKVPTNNNYTKDEIMAMPTIIVVPTSDPTKSLAQKHPTLSKKIKKVKTKKPSSTKLLGPLVIDVSSSPAAMTDKNRVGDVPSSKLSHVGHDTGLVKTVDVTKNASVPKDNIIPGLTQSSTPQVLPPLRKSSSTPRRNSHIRVLDFTTPRRILHETNEESTESNKQPIEIIVSRSPNVVFTETDNSTNNMVDMSNVKVHKIDTCQMSHLKDSSDLKLKKRINWDADLRMLAVSNTNPVEVSSKSKTKSKKKLDKKDGTKQNSKQTDDTSDSNKKKRAKRKLSPKGKNLKRRKLEEEEEQYNASIQGKESNVAVKPTFNIVPADIHKKTENSKVVEIQNNSNNEEPIETPESERISLQNEIGVKLNISDLLETPYKQALYDIQMETPKFLGSVLPDEPISDIKIMNIPTPRFFDTPKPTQTTPYSSRPTDYSSGGSYYKPDEQDYLRIPDLECIVTSTKADPNKDVLKQKECEIKTSLRPVRKCTKNVSYKARKTKVKATDDKVEIASNCSDSASANSSLYNSKEMTISPKTPKSNTSKLHSKSKKKLESKSPKKRKTPVKKDKINVFMKIKPRRPTPIKDNKRTKRKSVGLKSSPRVPGNKKVSGKEKSNHVTPTVSCAPTKSRRKSSTPRKIHCTKQFNSESSADSPDINITNTKISDIREQSTAICQDSDTEQLALRWSDDGSQDAKPRVSECEDISKIKEYIENTTYNKIDYNDGKGTLQVDLIKRGFDAETAKIIERDLLDTPPDIDEKRQSYVQITVTEKEMISLDKESSEPEIKEPEKVAADLPIVHDDEEEDEPELSVYECNEEHDNYINTCFSESHDAPNCEPVALKDSWSMEICIDDGMSIRLRATAFQTLFENEPQDVPTGDSLRETEIAVSSISNIDKLYTPLKDRRTQCYEIFDSTLTSLDTPLKLASPKEKVLETTEIEIVVEEEKVDIKDTKKRKRLHTSSSSDESLNESNKKPEAQYLFNSTNIQNIDIESVLKKLHGT